MLRGVNFEFDRAELTGASLATLSVVVAQLNECRNVRSVVGGHADAIGSEAYNQGLSQRRAESVREYLVSQGVAASQLEARGFGESQPIATNDTDEGRALNRGEIGTAIHRNGHQVQHVLAREALIEYGLRHEQAVGNADGAPGALMPLRHFENQRPQQPRIDDVAAKREVFGLLQSDQAWQQPRSSVIDREPTVDEDLREARGLSRKHDIAAKRQVAAATRCHTVDGGDRWL